MVCPYLTNQTVTQKYKDFQGNGMYFDIERSFAHCLRESCPFYVEPFAYGQRDELCARASKDKIEIALSMKISELEQ